MTAREGRQGSIWLAWRARTTGVIAKEVTGARVTEWLINGLCIASPRNKSHASNIATTANVFTFNQAAWPQMQGGRIDSTRKRASQWAQALKAHSGGSISTRSSRASVDSVFIEDFSDSNSGSSRSRGPREPSPVSGSETSVERGARWTSRLVNAALRPLTKRRAKRLVVNLISANDDDGPSARYQRRKAAEALLDLAEQEPDGTDIVTRRFIKKSSRRREGIRALFKLSDEELDGVENEAFPTTTEPTVSIRLLELIREYTKESLFIKTATSIIQSETQGAAAVLHFVTRMEDFFSHVDHSLIVDFGVRVVKTENSLTRTWYSGLTLLVTSIERTSPDNLSHLAGTLHVALSSVVGGVVEQGSRTRAGAAAKKEKSRFRDPPLLPLVARCCAKSEPVLDLLQFALPPPSILTSFIDLTLKFAHEMDASQCRFSLEGGFALTALAFLLQIPTAVRSVPPGRLPTVGALFVDIVLHPKAPEIQSEGSPDEEDMLRWLRTKLDHGVINALSRLPELNFEEVLASALKAALKRFNLPSTNPYEPLEIVERLLWLSNLKPNNEEIHRALVKARSCAFLVNVLAYTGGLNPQDRGLWRAKGLAITCLGNVLEEMDWIQLRDHITAEVIEVVVKIKDDHDTPIVQRGQALFLLQRYALVADRYGIEPYYREDTSSKTTKLR